MADKESMVRKSSKLILLEDIDTGIAEIKNPEIDAVITEPYTVGGIPAGPVWEFNAENISILWQKYALNIKETRGGLYALMNTFGPEIDMDKPVMRITVDSELQKEQFEQVLTSMKNYFFTVGGLKTEIQVLVVKDKDTLLKYYTPQDKLKRLIELNPSLKRFQKELGLDLDYD